MKRTSAVKWIWEVSGKIKWFVLLLLILQILDSVLAVSSAWIMRSLINSAVASDRDGFVRSAVMLLGLTLSQLLLLAVNRFLLEFSKSGAENKFKKRLFSFIMKKDYSDITSVHSGEWMNRLTNDTAVAAEGLCVIVPEVTGMIVKLLGALVSVVIFLPSLGFTIVPGGMLFVILTYAFRRKLKGLHKNIQESDGRLRVFMTERISSLMIIKAFGREESTVIHAEEYMKKHRSARMKRNHFSNICNIGFGIVLKGMYAVCAVFCGYGILSGSLDYGVFTAVLQLVEQIRSPFAQISGYVPKYYAMTASAERLMEAEYYDDDHAGEAVSASDAYDLYRNDLRSVVFENISFSYKNPLTRSSENMPAVLENFSMEIKKGEYVAFTGHSGCGKSTVLKLIMSLYRETAGRRYIRTGDGEKTLDSSLRELFSYVPQGNHLMSGTVRDIITFSDRNKCDQDEKIYSALEIACAGEFVSSLKDGLDTVLGERGAGISEGQMQRLAIARAVFTECPFLLLDEATSSLDELTERRVLENLKKLTDKTVIIITHRPAALEICDRKIVFGEEI